MGEFFGQTFGFLKVIGGATEEQPQKVRCRCVCGNEKDILIDLTPSRCTSGNERISRI
jgi:hypothetical protein